MKFGEFYRLFVKLRERILFASVLGRQKKVIDRNRCAQHQTGKVLLVRGSFLGSQTVLRFEIFDLSIHRSSGFVPIGPIEDINS